MPVGWTESMFCREVIYFFGGSAIVGIGRPAFWTLEASRHRVFKRFTLGLQTPSRSYLSRSKHGAPTPRWLPSYQATPITRVPATAV